MLAIKIWNYLNGYVIIRIEGLSLERLLNLALTKNLYLWDVKRLNKYQVDVCVYLKSLDHLMELIEFLGCSEKILEYRGLPFLIKRIKKRKMFLVGFLMFFLVIGIFSSFLWNIEINCLEQTSDEELKTLLNDNGINTGKFKRTMSEEQVKRILMNEYDYFSFIEAKYRGVKLVIDIKEEDLPPERVDRSIPVNIVARDRSVITKIINRKGETVAEVGQIVDIGDLLISGVIESEVPEIGEDGHYFVHSEGEIWARTRYETTVEDYIISIRKTDTGNIIRTKGIKINDRGIRLLNDIPFENYEEYIKENNLLDFSFLSIDFIKTISYEYREVELEEVKQDLDFLKKSNELKATEELNEILHESAEILSKDVIHYEYDNKLKTKVTIEADENISRKQIIQN